VSGIRLVATLIWILAWTVFAASLLSGCEWGRPKLTFGQGCKTCHVNVVLKDHDFPCERCHRGDPKALKKEVAHRGLIKSPSSPNGARVACIPCHEREVKAADASSHYTMAGEIGAVWKAFFPGDIPPRVSELPKEVPVRTLRGLVADLLRRRCLRCHVYSHGDGYPSTRRGLGCAACHMRPQENKPGIHKLYRDVPDENCLSCHYGNFVGWDYVGRFEKDIPEAFQVPFRGGRRENFSYGVQWFEMAPDIHRGLGLRCTDCHVKGPCQEGGKDDGLKCLDCHKDLSESIPGHDPRSRSRVSCDACHALWSFNDRGRTLVRQDMANYWAWYDLRYQGILGLQEFLEEMDLSDPLVWPVPFMRDAFTGEFLPGIWYQVFGERRWWPVTLGLDKRGRIRVMRPILDIALVYVDEDGFVILDALRPQGVNKGGLLPYSPHTIGRADLFRTMKVMKMLLGIT